MTVLQGKVSSPQSVVIDVQTQNDSIGAPERAMDPLVLPKSNLGMGKEVLTLQQVYPQSSFCWKKLPASRESRRTRNPIRAVVDPIMASYQRNKHKQDEDRPFISLALGDPTSSGVFEACPAVKSIEGAEVGMGSAGYVNALGTDALRERIAAFHSQMKHPMVNAREVDPSHVIVASGCSGALDLALKALLDPGTYLLVPNPGFPLYQVIAESLGAYVLPYNLLPDEEWNVDINHVELLVRSARLRGMNIRGIVLNNPSNPTGTVYTLNHMKSIVRACDEFCLPIIADEIYGDLTYDESRPFIPTANVVTTISKEIKVPVVTCSGIGKQFLVPGWRVGWLIFHDNAEKSLQEVQQGSKQLAQIVLGASHPAQTMATAVLEASVSKDETIISWQKTMRTKLASNAALVQQKLAETPGLCASPAQGAMYIMVTFNPQHFDFITKGKSPGEQFSAKLLEEENVFVLPGSCFGMPNAFRLVFCATEQTLEQAMLRIVAFSSRHCTAASKSGH